MKTMNVKLATIVVSLVSVLSVMNSNAQSTSSQTVQPVFLQKDPVSGEIIDVIPLDDLSQHAEDFPVNGTKSQKLDYLVHFGMGGHSLLGIEGGVGILVGDASQFNYQSCDGAFSVCFSGADGKGWLFELQGGYKSGNQGDPSSEQGGHVRLNVGRANLRDFGGRHFGLRTSGLSYSLALVQTFHERRDGLESTDGMGNTLWIGPNVAYSLFGTLSLDALVGAFGDHPGRVKLGGKLSLGN